MQGLTMTAFLETVRSDLGDVIYSSDQCLACKETHNDPVQPVSHTSPGHHMLAMLSFQQGSCGPGPLQTLHWWRTQTSQAHGAGPWA